MRAAGPTLAAALALFPCAAAADDAPRSLTVFGMSGQSFGERRRHGFAEFGSVAVQWGRPVSRHTELLVEAHPAFVVRQPRLPPEGPRETVEVFACDLGVRLLAGPSSWRARPYLEVLEGGFYALRRVPATGSTFNFLTQAGVGVALPVGARWHPRVSYRWVHVSNAGTGHHNPDWDFHTLLLGGTLAFGGAR